MFRKELNPIFEPTSVNSATYAVDVETKKDVIASDGSEPITLIERRKLSQDDYAKSLGLPNSENYQLRDMLAAGLMPEEVNCHGMLDSDDSSDLQNDGLGLSLFDKLSSMTKVSSSEPAPEPTPEPTPEPVPATE